MLRDAAAGDAAGPHEGYTKTRGVVVTSSSRIASGTFDAGHHNKCTTVRSMRLSTVLEDIWSIGVNDLLVIDEIWLM